MTDRQKRGKEIWDNAMQKSLMKERRKKGKW